MHCYYSTNGNNETAGINYSNDNQEMMNRENKFKSCYCLIPIYWTTFWYSSGAISVSVYLLSHDMHIFKYVEYEFVCSTPTLRLQCLFKEVLVSSLRLLEDLSFDIECCNLHYLSLIFSKLYYCGQGLFSWLKYIP